jgi:hypothetical protein
MATIDHTARSEEDLEVQDYLDHDLHDVEELHPDHLLRKAHKYIKENVASIPLGVDAMVDTLANSAKSHYTQFFARFGQYPPLYLCPRLQLIEYVTYDAAKNEIMISFGLSGFVNLLSVRFMIRDFKLRNSYVGTDADYFNSAENGNSDSLDWSMLQNYIDSYNNAAMLFMDIDLEDDLFVNKVLFKLQLPKLHVKL